MYISALLAVLAVSHALANSADRVIGGVGEDNLSVQPNGNADVHARNHLGCAEGRDEEVIRRQAQLGVDRRPAVTAVALGGAGIDRRRARRA